MKTNETEAKKKRKRGRPITEYRLLMTWLQGMHPEIDKVIEEYDQFKFSYKEGLDRVGDILEGLPDEEKIRLGYPLD